MKGAALRAVGRAASDRVLGTGPGPMRAMAAAIVTGTVTAALTYRVLRSNSDKD